MVKSVNQRGARLAAALKENLKRRKAQARAKGKKEAPPAHALGTAPQASLEGNLRPKTAPNRN